MLNETADLCDLWEDEPLARKDHSRLHHLQPIGVGSSHVESLMSYVMRLADSHSVRPYTLIGKEITPLMEREYLYQQGMLRSPFGQQSAALNGVSPTTNLLVQALAQLTGRQDLHFLTMLPLTHVLSQRLLVRRTQAWGPFCYEGWRASDQTLYTPLLWICECVKVCPKHDIFLHMKCPNLACSRPVPPLSLRGQIGYCQRCGQWLGSAQISKTSHVALSEKERIWLQWVAHIVGEILAAIPHLPSLPSSNTFTTSINTLIKEQTKGSPLFLARQTHTHQMSVWNWRYGSKPELESLLRVSAHLKMSPLSLLTGVASEAVFSKIQAFPDEEAIPERPKPAQRQLDLKAIQTTLETLIQQPEDPAPSVREIERRMGLHRNRLAPLFPEQCQILSRRYRQNQSQKRSLGVQRRCEMARQATQAIHAQGRYPSKRQVELFLDKPAFFREAQVKAAWHEAIRERGLQHEASV
jgi:hypothetical protein